MKMREILFAMGDLLLPRTCVVCGSMLTLAERESGAEMCLDCFLNLPRTHIHRLPTLSAGRNAVQERLGDGPPLLIGGAWFYYGRDSAYASLIRSAKYNDRPALARGLGRAYGSELLADILDLPAQVDVLVPVPMHWRKQMRRGYNQSERIAMGLSDATGIAVGDNLRAVRAHRTQTRRTAEERRRNISGLFTVEHSEELLGLNVAVVDDVITTGTTAAEAARAILASGAATVSLFALGITQG